MIGSRIDLAGHFAGWRCLRKPNLSNYWMMFAVWHRNEPAL